MERLAQRGRRGARVASRRQSGCPRRGNDRPAFRQQRNRRRGRPFSVVVRSARSSAFSSKRGARFRNPPTDPETRDFREQVCRRLAAETRLARAAWQTPHRGRGRAFASERGAGDGRTQRRQRLATRATQGRAETGHTREFEDLQGAARFALLGGDAILPPIVLGDGRADVTVGMQVAERVRFRLCVRRCASCSGLSSRSSRHRSGRLRFLSWPRRSRTLARSERSR